MCPFAQSYHASVGRHAPLHVFSSELRYHHAYPRACLSTRILPAPSRFAVVGGTEEGDEVSPWVSHVSWRMMMFSFLLIRQRPCMHP